MDLTLLLSSGFVKALAALFYILLIVFESYISFKKKKKVYEKNDTFINLSLGVFTSVTKLLIKGVTLGFFYLVQQHLALATIPINSIVGFIVLFVLNDLTFYWYHRVSHESRLFWSLHVAHHSSSIFNASTAIRGNFLHFLYRFIFWSPLVIIGFDPLLVVLVDEIGFYYQMWIHTEAIKKMPRWFERIFNSPMHHRVHHGSNALYLDKNYAAVFIIWDKWFGSYQGETEKVNYGLTKPLEKQTLFNVITHELNDIWRDAWLAKSWKERLFYIFGHPGKIARYKTVRQRVPIVQTPNETEDFGKNHLEMMH